MSFITGYAGSVADAYSGMSIGERIASTFNIPKSIETFQNAVKAGLDSSRKEEAVKQEIGLNESRAKAQEAQARVAASQSLNPLDDFGLFFKDAGDAVAKNSWVIIAIAGLVVFFVFAWGKR